jgi:hypothetical protein
MKIMTMQPQFDKLRNAIDEIRLRMKYERCIICEDDDPDTCHHCPGPEKTNDKDK